MKGWHMPFVRSNLGSIYPFSFSIRIRRFAFFLILSLAIGTSLPLRTFGQVVTASLQGTVQDTTGASVPGAKVETTNISTGVQTRTVTNANGRFVFASLLPRWSL